ncbi:MAG: hypothetical protein LQ346_007938 [Caloplaca aetnensis]|nr:MAG: hypothetical protein LQ346_007938 [Caloplaca aetnensis]
MKSWGILALQLLHVFPLFVDAVTLDSTGQLETRERRKSQEEFDQVTTSLRDQGACRQYLRTGMTLTSVSTCDKKCGDLVKKAQEAGEYTSLGCVAGGTPTLTDPQGNDYEIGNCVCDAPIVEEIFDDVLMALPAIAEIGCSILFGAFDLILNIGAAAIPGVGPAMTVGMKAGVQAAKTIAENGQDASSFLKWFDSPCGHSKYTDMIDKIFDPLSNVPDTVVPGLGCKGKKCPGKKDPKDGKEEGPESKTDKKEDSPSTKTANQPSTTKDDATSSEKTKTSSKSAQPDTTSTQASTTASGLLSSKTELSMTTTRPSTTTSLTKATTSGTNTNTGLSSTRPDGSSSSSSTVNPTSLTSDGRPSLTTLDTSTRSRTSLSSTSSAVPTDACDARRTKRSVDLVGRNPNNLRMSNWSGTTFHGSVTVRQARMCEADVRAYAERGYNQIRNLNGWNGVVMVSALFVPDVGVFVASKPRGINAVNDQEVVAEFQRRVSREFPAWDVATTGREIQDPTESVKLIEYLHSEDLALLDGGNAYCRARNVRDRSKIAAFPARTHMVTWGRYDSDDGAAGVRPPCSGGKLSVPCSAVLSRLKVTASVD